MRMGTSATQTESVQKAKKKLTHFLTTLDEVPTEILLREASNIEMEAQLKVPFDTGKLENSIRVRGSKSKYRPGINISASARSKRGYNYAGIQHENRNFHHRVGRDHFLSLPLESATRRIKKEIKTGIQVEWRGYNG